MSTPFCLAVITAPSDKAGAGIAEKIVQSRLAACVNIVPMVQSVYWWKGKRERAKEAMLIVKTRKKSFLKLIAFVQKIHPYSVPEIIALPIEAGSPAYLKWLAAETR